MPSNDTSVRVPRTENGAPLRSAINSAIEEELKQTPGKKVKAVFIYEKSGASLGAAFKSEKGWELTSTLRMALNEGRAKDITWKTQFSF